MLCMLHLNNIGQLYTGPKPLHFPFSLLLFLCIYIIFKLKSLPGPPFKDWLNIISLVKSVLVPFKTVSTLVFNTAKEIHSSPLYTSYTALKHFETFFLPHTLKIRKSKQSTRKKKQVSCSIMLSKGP